MNYFAYGSNMNLEHMRRMCGWHFRVLGVGKLPGYELGPDMRGYFNVRPKEGSQVFGVLYEVDQQSLDILDDFEGCPDVFQRVKVKAMDTFGKEYEAWIYLEPPTQFGPAPVKENYVRRVLAGAIENHLPEEWIKFLHGHLPEISKI